MMRGVPFICLKSKTAEVASQHDVKLGYADSHPNTYRSSVRRISTSKDRVICA